MASQAFVVSEPTKPPKAVEPLSIPSTNILRFVPSAVVLTVDIPVATPVAVTETEDPPKKPNSFKCRTAAAAAPLKARSLAAVTPLTPALTSSHALSGETPL